MHLRSLFRARALPVLLPTALVALGGPVASASAAPVSLDLKYTCTFPLLKPQPLVLRISSDIPSEVAIGKSTGAFKITATADVSAGSVFGLRAVEAATLEGAATAATDVVLPTGNILPTKIPTTIVKADIPASGGFTTGANGNTPPLTFQQAGTVKLNVKDLVLTLTPRLADGTLTGLDTFETECAQDAGQNNTFATIKVVDPTPTPTPTPTPAPTQPLSYGLSGSALLKTLATGTVPLAGVANLSRASADGSLTGDVLLNPARGNLRALNFLPVKSSLIFSSAAGATGSLRGDTLSLTTKQNIRLTNVSVFGINLVSGACRTSAPSTITLNSSAGAFPLSGGTALSGFTIAPFTDCGYLGTIVSGLAAGNGNVMSLKFAAPAAA